MSNTGCTRRPVPSACLGRVALSYLPIILPAPIHCDRLKASDGIARLLLAAGVISAMVLTLEARGLHWLAPVLL
jgi:hypothetical protein